jgi:DNA-binding beta-propeller fold protein YncE
MGATNPAANEGSVVVPAPTASRMTKLARVAAWFAAALVLALCVVTALLIFPGRPADSHSLRFEGYIVLPKVKNAGALTMLDYLTVSGDDLFVTSVSTGAVYKVGLNTRAMPESADVSVFELEPAAHGVIVDPTSHLAFVTRSEADTVDVFDPKNMRLVKRIPVATDPDGIFYDPSSKLVYVASSDAMLATLIDPASQNSIGTLSLGGKPEFAALDPETKLLYQNLADTNAVIAVDLTKRLIVQRWPLEGCEMPTGMAIDAADRRLFIACGKSAKLAIFDLDLHRVVATVPVGLGPDSVAYDPELHRIYVTGLVGRLSVVNQAAADTYRVVDSIYLHFNAHTLAVDPATHGLFVGYASLAIPPRLAVFTPNR